MSQTWNDVISMGDSRCAAELEAVFAAIHYDRHQHLLVFADDKSGIAPLLFMK